MLLEQDKAKILTSLSKLTGAKGRFDYIVAPNKVIGIVDYAHSPDAIQNILSTIHDIRKGNEKVITVIGCGGDRDKTKRPIMAKAACEWSDKVIFTSDNPRSEDPTQIIKDMEEGVDPAFKRHVVKHSGPEGGDKNGLYAGTTRRYCISSRQGPREIPGNKRRQESL